VLRINRVELSEFMNVKHADLTFNHLLNIISGPSASGKSAIFDAISICISSKKRASSYASYVKQGAERAHILLDALINNESALFDVTINADKKGGACVTLITYKGVTYRNTDASELLKSFDIEYYADIILTLQSDQDIVSISPGARSIYLQRLLNFDFLPQQAQVRDEMTQLTREQTTKKTRLFAVTAMISQATKRLHTIDALSFTPDDRLRVSNSIKSLQASINSLAKKRDELSKLTSDQLSKTRELQTLVSSLHSVDTQVTTLTALRRAQESVEAQLEKIDIRKRELSDERSKLTLTEEAQTANIKSLLSRLTATNADKGVVKHRLDELEELKRLLEEGKCSRCGQETGPAVMQTISAKNLGESLTSIDEARDLLMKTIEKTRSAARELNDEANELSENERSMTVKLGETSRSLIVLNEEEKQLVRDEERLTEQLQDDRVEKLPKLMKEKQRLVSSKMSLEEEIRTIEQGIAAATESLSSYDSLAKQLSSATEALSSYDHEEAERTRLINENKQTNAEITKLHEEELTLSSELRELQLGLDIRADALKILVKELPEFMILKTSSTLESEMNDFIHNVFPDYDVQLSNSKKGLEFRYTKTKQLDESATNKWIDAQMSSGFERALLSMAFKNSLCSMYGLDFCLLDECDKNADDDSSQKLFDMILGDSDYSQIFVVSHKKSLVQYLIDSIEDNVLYMASGGKFTEAETPYDDLS
jgi:chromosome segregation ATPase